MTVIRRTFLDWLNLFPFLIVKIYMQHLRLFKLAKSHRCLFKHNEHIHRQYCMQAKSIKFLNILLHRVKGYQHVYLVFRKRAHYFEAQQFQKLLQNLNICKSYSIWVQCRGINELMSRSTSIQETVFIVLVPVMDISNSSLQVNVAFNK